MALQKQVISYALTGGLDTKTDPKIVAAPKLLVLENARRNKSGRISKRYGHEAISRTITGSSDTTEDADALGVYNDELLIFRKQSLYSYSDNSGQSADKGGCVSASVTVDDVTRNNYQQEHADSAVYNNISVIAWEDERGGIWMSVMDVKTKTMLVSDYRIASAGTRPRCLNFQNYLYVFWADGNDIKGLKVNPYDPATIAPTATVSSSLNGANPYYDVVAQDQSIVVGFNVQGAVQTRLHKLDNVLVVTATANIAEAATNCITLTRGASSYVFVLQHNATGVRCTIYNVYLTVVVATFTVEAVANVVNISAYKLPDDTGVRCFYHVTAAATYNHLIRNATITNAGAVGTPAVFLRSVGIASKAWAYSSDTTERGFIGIVHESTLQSTFFVARQDGMIVAKAQSGIAGGLLYRTGYPASVGISDTGVYRFAILSKRKTASDGSNFVTQKGASLLTLDFSDLRNFSTAQLANNALIVGGAVQTYDSQSAVEHGFHVFPENITLAESAGGALTATGTYSYQVCYEWVDNKGQLHRSAPSVPIAITLTGVNNRVTLTVPTLRLTQKKGSATSGPRRDNCQVVVYRTETLGSVYYQATSPTSPSYNDPAADTIAIVDDLADSSLISRQPLYTTGSVVENIAPPSASLIAVYRNRVFLAGTEDDTIWYSKQVKPNRPVEFNDAFIIKADPVGGKIKAIETLNDRVLIFKENSIYYVNGDGPNDLGQGGVINPPEVITGDVGCIDSKSVATMPTGLLFKSRKGFYLIDNGLNLSYVGAEIEEFNSYEVSSANLIRDANEVRITLVDGPVLTYNYYYNEWSIWTNFVADDAIVWTNSFVAIKSRIGSTALVVKQVKDFFLDVNQSYSLKIGLAWAGFAQLQGFQRIWRAHFLGDYRSPHTLKVSVGYNFTPVISDEYYWNPVTNLGITEYGDGAYYGSDPVYGGEVANNGTYQIRVHLVQQKSQAVRFILEDTALDGSCEGFDLSGVAFEVGLKRGSMKLQAAQTL